MLTDSGRIETEVVVNAAGMWAPQVAAMVGALLVSTPVEHQHIALAAVQGHELPHDLPCFRDPDYLVYGKSEAGGALFGGYEHDPAARWLDGVPWDHSEQHRAGRRGALCAAHGGRREALPVPGRRRRRQARLPPRRDDARRQPAGRRGAGRAWLLRRGRALAQRLRRCGRHRQGRGRARDRRRERAGSAVVPPLALRRRPPRSASTRPRTRARPTATTTDCAIPLDSDVLGRPRRISPLHERMQDAGAVFATKNGWERADYCEPGRPWRRAGEEQRAFGWAEPPYTAVLAEESAGPARARRPDRHDVVRQDRRRRARALSPCWSASATRTSTAARAASSTRSSSTTAAASWPT